MPKFTTEKTTTNINSGFGVGLRARHYNAILKKNPNIDFFEILTEDYMVDGGAPLAFLDRVRELYPIVMHGVSLNIASTDPIDTEYLSRLKSLIDRVDPLWVSDHLCWTGVEGVNSHDLLPVPFTEECLVHVVDRIKRVQKILGRKILMENISTYVTFKQSTMSEWEFLKRVAIEAGCDILLDINNIYVNAFNHGFSAEEYLNAIPVDRVKQFHIAGYKQMPTHLIDTHGEAIQQGVWALYETAVKLFPKVPTLLERDIDIPDLPELMRELDRAREIKQAVVESEVDA